MTNTHFEELWEKCEQLHQQVGDKSTIQELVEQLIMKLNLYQTMDEHTELPEEDRQKAKSRLLGEIILTLTNVSLKDNVNVFEALKVALQYRSVSYFSDKYQAT